VGGGLCAFKQKPRGESSAPGLDLESSPLRAVSGSLFAQLGNLRAGLGEQRVHRGLGLAGNRRELLHAAAQLIAQLGAQFSLFGNQFAGGLG